MELPTFLNKEIIIVFLVIYAIVGLLGYLISSKRGSIGLICFSLILLFGAITHYFFKISFIPKLLPYAFLPALVLGLVLGLTNYEPKAEPIKDVRIKVRGRTITIRNVFAGVGIFGASRSGKTASVIYSLLVHFSKFEFSID